MIHLELTDCFRKYRVELMGISIAWILAFHSGIEAPSNTVLRALWYCFVSFGGGCGVDIFLVLSGFGITYASMKRTQANEKENWKEYYKRRISRILPAYFMVAIPYYIFTTESYCEFFHNVFFLNFIVDGRRDFWYILAILVCYFTFPLMKVLWEKTNFRASLLIFTSASFVIAIVVELVCPSLYSNWEIALWRFPCFWIGCYYGVLSKQGKVKEFSVATVVFTIFGLLFLVSSGLSRNTFTFMTPVIMVVGCFIAEGVKLKKSVFGKIFAFLGGRTLEIYLVHVSFGILFADYFYYKLNQSIFVRLIVYLGVSLIMAISLQYLQQRTKVFLKRPY